MINAENDASLAGLAELIRISEEAREGCQAMAKVVEDARERCGEAGTRVADHVLAGVEVPNSLIREYKTARDIFNSTTKAVHEKYRRYSEISDQLLKELKKPSAAATAEGNETSNPTGEVKTLSGDLV